MKRVERIIIAISVSVGLVFGYVACQSLAQIIFLFCAAILKPGTQETLMEIYKRHMADVYLAAALLYAGLIIVGLLIYRKVKQNHYTDFLKPPASGKTFPFVITTFIMGMCLNLALSNIISLIPFPERWISQNSESVGAFSESNLIIMLLAQSIAAPLVEELIFRGVMYHALRCAPIVTNRALCIGISAVVISAVFGWFHGNALQALYCFCFSLVLILVVEKTGSLWGAVITHMGFNSPWVLMLFFYKFYNASAHLLNAVVFGVLSLVFIVLSLYFGGVRRPQLKA